METVSPSVTALVLTHNAPAALARCLGAVLSQSRPPDRVLVIDNASTPRVDADMLPHGVEVLRSEVNGGPAGGHYLGIDAFYRSPADLAWVMDDDCVPALDALEMLLVHDEALLVFPTWVDEPTGDVVNWPAWCGFLMARGVVDRIGLPRADFVWWAEDTEYLHWRVPEAGIRVARATDAVVLHGRVRRYGRRPPWKFYYEARNSVYYRLYVQRRRGRRFYRLARTLMRMGGAALRHPDRGRAPAMLLRGVLDGLTGRMGLRVPLRAREAPVAPDS